MASGRQIAPEQDVAGRITRRRGLIATLSCLLLVGCSGALSISGGGARVSIDGSGIGAAVVRGSTRAGVRVGSRSGGGGGDRAPAPRRSPVAVPAPADIGRFSRKPLVAGRLTSRFGEPRGARVHQGVDYSAAAGTMVFAAGPGRVVTMRGSLSYGNHVRIDHGRGTVTTYAHLSRFAPGLAVGSSVERGQRIGSVGSTGRSTSPHLHYELAIDGTKVDPLAVTP